MKAPDITRDRNDPTTVRGPSESDDEGVVGIGFLTRPAWVSFSYFFVLSEYRQAECFRIWSL